MERTIVRTSITRCPALCSILIVVASQAVVAGELRVPDAFPDITAALAAARPGDMIRVHGGVYTGNLVLDKEVHLTGECDPVVRGGGRGDVITLAADGCSLRGFMVEKAGMDMAVSDAGIRLKSSYNLVERNRISECLFGMYLERSSSNLIRGNTIAGLLEKEVGERGSGIHLYDSHRNRFEENTVLDARDGIYFDHSNRNTVKWCSFTGSRYGLHYMSSDDNTFVENRFSTCTAGATIMFSRRLVFEGNWFVHNRGFSSIGALLKDCYDSTAVGNLFADNSTAMLLDNSMNNTFRRNNILRNDIALHLFSGSDANTFTENNFVDNLSPIQLLGRRTTTRWSVEGRGNHWSDYDGYDLDGNGIGDVPYRIQNVFEYLEGEYPALRFFLVSPAAAAMKSGEEAFPMFEFSHEVDPAPLMSPAAAPLGSRWTQEHRKPYRLAGATAFGGMVACLGMVAASKRRRL